MDMVGDNLDFKGGKVFGSLAEFQGENLNLRVSYTRLHTSRDFPASSPVVGLREGIYAFASMLGDPGLTRQADAMVFKDQVFQYFSVGLNWQQGPFRVDAVGAKVRSASGLVPTLNSAYGSVGYRIGQVVPYLLASHIDTDRHEPYVGALSGLGPQGAALAAGIKEFSIHSNAKQSTVSLGLRWDFHPKADLKFQVDRVSSDPNATMFWANLGPGWDGKTTVASVVLDFVF
jgi:hypothetical protein